MPVTTGETALGVDSKTRWMKRVLLPFWILRCLLMALLFVLYIIALVSIKQSDTGVSLSAGVLAALIVLILLLVLCVGIDGVSMIMFARHTLKPKTFLVFQIIETFIWLIILILEIAGSARRNRSGQRSSRSLAWILLLVLFLSFLALLIYASVIYHRTRKAARRGNYTTPIIVEPENTAYEPRSGFVPSNPPSSAHSNPFDNRYATNAGSFELRNEQPQGHQQPTSVGYEAPYPQAVELPAGKHAERYM